MVLSNSSVKELSPSFIISNQFNVKLRPVWWQNILSNEKCKHFNNFYNKKKWKTAYLIAMLDTIINKNDTIDKYEWKQFKHDSVVVLRAF